jgi:hypothetical protein
VVAAPLHDRRPSPINDRYSVSSHSLNQPAWAVHLGRDHGGVIGVIALVADRSAFDFVRNL